MILIQLFLTVAFAATQGSIRLWPNGIVPYAVGQGLNADMIRSAILTLQARTGNSLQFVQRSNEQAYVQFVLGSSCSSRVGRSGGVQQINLSQTCASAPRVIIHEILHALGFVHEQERPDRDQYIDVRFENIIPGLESQFEADPKYIPHTPYDFGSVLHYRATGMSKNGQPTLVSKVEGLQPPNVPNPLSDYDVYAVCMVYGFTKCVFNGPLAYLNTASNV
jgi:hypothetical protein